MRRPLVLADVTMLQVNETIRVQERVDLLESGLVFFKVGKGNGIIADLDLCRVTVIENVQSRNLLCSCVLFQIGVVMLTSPQRVAPASQPAGQIRVVNDGHFDRIGIH